MLVSYMFCGAALCTKCRCKGSVFFWFVQEVGRFFCVGGGGYIYSRRCLARGRGRPRPQRLRCFRNDASRVVSYGVVWSDGDSGQ